MKVLDFGCGCPVAVINNWCYPSSGGLAFIQQSYIAKILGGAPHEVHCYDESSISENATKESLEGDVGKVVLHANQRRLPRSVDMICAFNPDPLSIFGPQDDSSYSPEKIIHFSKYSLLLAQMIDTRLRIGGLLAIQFDKYVKPSKYAPYDGTQPFLERVLAHTQSKIETLYYSDALPEVAGVVPLKGAFEFSSLHIYMKIGGIVGA